ncbi:MAG: hypothetical protein JXA25_02590, partial [Anaerolineales bacterium]|nr:hypothetical protein [Anaerolineales bacterium]
MKFLLLMPRTGGSARAGSREPAVQRSNRIRFVLLSPVLVEPAPIRSILILPPASGSARAGSREPAVQHSN